MANLVTRMHGRTIPAALIFGLVALTLAWGSLFDSRVQPTAPAEASTATATVTVMNLPPTFTTNAEESPASSTSSPTNVGSSTIWVATADDTSGDSYYLLICKTAANPTPGTLGAAPECNGGASNRWALSVVTAPTVQASASRVALVGDAEVNVWYAFVCDNNVDSTRCNNTPVQGNGNDAAASAFHVNHRPSFTIFIDNSDASSVPGSNIRFSTTSTDADVISTQDPVVLYVCRTNSFHPLYGCLGGSYCSSTSVGPFTTDPYCDYAIPNPYKDRTYPAFGFVIDGHSFPATTGGGQIQGQDSGLIVGNASPTIAGGGIVLNSGNSLVLTTPAGQTSGFTVKYVVSDNNLCISSSSTNEISSAIINVYRSAVGQASCQLGTDFNANRCYTNAITGASRWTVTTAQDPDTCSDDGVDTTAGWTSTFTMWYVADPTDGTTASDSPYFAETWLASVQATDNNSGTSALVEGTNGLPGQELTSFLAIDLQITSIPYGSWAPGDTMPNLSVTTTLAAVGNVGVDEDLSGTHMCVPYPTCSGSATDTIVVTNQQYATSTIAYNTPVLAKTLQLTSGWINLNNPKSTSTSTPATTNTYWGIAIPGTITKAGGYTGVNTIIGVKSSGLEWSP